MATPQRITGLPNGSIDVDRRDVNFTLTLSERGDRPFVMRYGAAAQVTAALGRMLLGLRHALAQQPGHAAEEIVPEEVLEAQVRRDELSGQVLLLLTAGRGIPYSFRLPAQDASQLAALLKSESARSGPVGHA